MGLPLNKRDYDVFISYAHSESAFVEQLYDWLQHSAGLQVWWDERDLAAGAFLATGLQKAIERCRAVILIASDESLQRGWVKAEYNAAFDESTKFSDFRIVALRMGNANVGDLMRGVSWIDVPEQSISVDVAVAVIRALYRTENTPNPHKARDVYVSASWNTDDNLSANAVCKSLVDQGLRLIGDSRDQKGFGSGDRVREIMSSCGVFVAIVPYRGEETATRGAAPYKYFLREIDLANELQLPSVVIADPRIHHAGGDDQNWLTMKTEDQIIPDEVQHSLRSLWDLWREPAQPHYVFCAMDLDSEIVRLGGPIRQLIQNVTSMPTKVGNEIHEGNPENVNAAVRLAVVDAFLVIADLTDDNVNVCIEAGMALAVGTNVELLAAGPNRRPPFMLRERNLRTYKDDVQQVGLIHTVSRPYRRRVINAEL